MSANAHFLGHSQPLVLLLKKKSFGRFFKIDVGVAKARVLVRSFSHSRRSNTKLLFHRRALSSRTVGILIPGQFEAPVDRSSAQQKKGRKWENKCRHSPPPILIEGGPKKDYSSFFREPEIIGLYFGRARVGTWGGSGRGGKNGEIPFEICGK